MTRFNSVTRSRDTDDLFGSAAFECSTLNERDLRTLVDALPSWLSTFMHDQTVYAFAIGGGYIRSMLSRAPVNDIDVFCLDPKLSQMNFGMFIENITKPSNMIRTTNPISKTVLFECLDFPAVQFIPFKKATSDVELITRFDFSCCQAAIRYDQKTHKWVSVMHHAFYSDLAARRLCYTGVRTETDVPGTWLRLRKFMERGYTFDNECLARLVAHTLQSHMPDDIFGLEKFETEFKLKLNRNQDY